MFQLSATSFLSSWIFKDVIFVLILAAVATFIVRRVLSYIAHRVKNKIWLHNFIETAGKPLTWLIFGSGCITALRNSPLAKRLAIGVSIDQLQSLLFVGVVIHLSFAIKRIVFAFLMSKNDSNKVVLAAVSKVASIAIYINALLMVLHVVGLPLQALLAFGGVGGMAIGWAAKDIIANFFGGFMIFVNRPFAIGEWIKGSKGFEGTVEEIGWYMTKIRTFERRPMYIPNSLVSDSMIENPGRMYNRRIKEDIGLRYDDLPKIPQVILTIEEMLKSHPGIDQEQTLMVHFVGFAEHSLIINIYTFTKTTNWKEYRTVQQDVFMKVANIIADCGTEIAYPTRTIQIQKVDSNDISSLDPHILDDLAK